jgi:hypothetical protein
MAGRHPGHPSFWICRHGFPKTVAVLLARRNPVIRDTDNHLVGAITLALPHPRGPHAVAHALLQCGKAPRILFVVTLQILALGPERPIIWNGPWFSRSVTFGPGPKSKPCHKWSGTSARSNGPAATADAPAPSSRLRVNMSFSYVTDGTHSSPFNTHVTDDGHVAQTVYFMSFIIAFFPPFVLRFCHEGFVSGPLHKLRD